MQRYLHKTIANADLLIAKFLVLESHADSLSGLAARYLLEGQFQTALVIADRRCRIKPRPFAVDHVIRFEALVRAGVAVSPLSDLDRAVEIDPDCIPALRRIVLAGTDDQKEAAALRIVELDRTTPSLHAALTSLRSGKIAAVAFATVIDAEIRGWVAWRGHAPISVEFTNGKSTAALTAKPQPDHALATCLGSAANFAVSAATSHGHWLGTAGADETKLTMRATFSGFTPAPAPARLPLRKGVATPDAPDVTVVVPVYGDLGATRACFDSLRLALETEALRVRVIAVDDASPVAGMEELLDELPFDMIRAPKNLGFVGAVNAALAHALRGDILLLNADTIVPPGAIGRLAAAAHSAPDIGTVTPLSNNGELTSLPVPFKENPLPDVETVAAIDRIAATTGRGETIDMPTGIGFALYIKRACVDAVVGLSNRYERGYGEDVDICLAARDAGFRSVCAVSVFVGHEGTRSFGADKRRLVMRNLKRLNGRFPDHEREVDAFVAADPLRAVRHRMGREMLSGYEGRLIIASEATRLYSEARIETCAGAEGRAALAIVRRDSLLLRSFDKRARIAAETEFTFRAEHPDALELLNSLAIQMVEVHALPAARKLGFRPPRARTEVHLTDMAWLSHRGGSGPDASSYITAIASADRIVAPCEPARRLWQKRFPGATVELAETDAESDAPAVRQTKGASCALGVILIHETARCRALLHELRRLPRRPDDRPALTVLGATSDDLALMRPGNLMVTGAAAPGELPDLAQIYGLSHILLLASGAVFGSPLADAARRLGLPSAEFDWTRDQTTGDGADLAIDPALSDAEVADLISTWMRA